MVTTLVDEIRTKGWSVCMVTTLVDEIRTKGWSVCMVTTLVDEIYAAKDGVSVSWVLLW